MGDNFKVSASWAHKFSLSRFIKEKCWKIFCWKSDLTPSIAILWRKITLINQVSIVNPPNIDVKSHQKTSTYESHKKFSFTSAGSKSMCETVLTLKWAMFNNNIWWSIQIFQRIYSKNHKPAENKNAHVMAQHGIDNVFHENNAQGERSSLVRRNEKSKWTARWSHNWIIWIRPEILEPSQTALVHTFIPYDTQNYRRLSPLLSNRVRLGSLFAWLKKKLLECLAYPGMKFIQESLNSQFTWEEQ